MKRRKSFSPPQAGVEEGRVGVKVDNFEDAKC